MLCMILNWGIVGLSNFGFTVGLRWVGLRGWLVVWSSPCWVNYLVMVVLLLRM